MGDPRVEAVVEAAFDYEVCKGGTAIRIPSDTMAFALRWADAADAKVRVSREALDRLREMVAVARQQTYRTSTQPGYIDCDDIAAWLDSLEAS